MSPYWLNRFVNLAVALALLALLWELFRSLGSCP